MSRPEAEQFVREKLQGLRPEDYVETVEMDYDSGPMVADVYGVTDEHGGWYVKFHIEHGQVQVISCHEPEHELACKGGQRVKGQ